MAAPAASGFRFALVCSLAAPAASAFHFAVGGCPAFAGYLTFGKATAVSKLPQWLFLVPLPGLNAPACFR